MAANQTRVAEIRRKATEQERKPWQFQAVRLFGDGFNATVAPIETSRTMPIIRYITSTARRVFLCTQESYYRTFDLGTERGCSPSPG
jgi:hypothetical protein